MQKSIFESFISKYNLGGACESVLFKVDGDVLSTRSISDDKNVLTEVAAPAQGMEEGEFAVYDTSRLRSMLGVLEDNLSSSVQRSSERPTSIKFSDKGSVATFVLADAGVIPPVPDLKKTPKFELSVDLDGEFITKFIKAKSALSDVELFTVIANEGETTADIYLGYSSMNTNRIRLGVEKDPEVTLSEISFSANYLREIFMANKGASGTMKISSKGLCCLTFKDNTVNSVYYLVEIDTKD